MPEHSSICWIHFLVELSAVEAAAAAAMAVVCWDAAGAPWPVTASRCRHGWLESSNGGKGCEVLLAALMQGETSHTKSGARGSYLDLPPTSRGPLCAHHNILFSVSSGLTLLAARSKTKQLSLAASYVQEFILIPSNSLAVGALCWSLVYLRGWYPLKVLNYWRCVLQEYVLLRTQLSVTSVLCLSISPWVWDKAVSGLGSTASVYYFVPSMPAGVYQKPQNSIIAWHWDLKHLCCKRHHSQQILCLVCWKTSWQEILAQNLQSLHPKTAALQ